MSKALEFAEDLEKHWNTQAPLAVAAELRRLAELEKDCERLERYWNEAMATHRNIAELEQQLEEARKQMEAQKDEWLSWEAKRRDLEKDAERYRWLRNSTLVDGEINETMYVAIESPDWPNKWALVGDDLDAAIKARGTK